jgi:hypothetical protein
MIEFENDWIALAAINTRMGEEILKDVLSAGLAVTLMPHGGALDVCGAVTSVMFA